MAPARPDKEAALWKSWEARDLETTCTEIVKLYGAEILGFQVAMLHDDALGRDAFSRFEVAVWTGIEGFEGRASFRTWCYGLARNAAYREVDDPYRRRRVDLDKGPELEVHNRTSTAWHRKTGPKEGIRRLREQLEPHERELLILRIDRGMGWKEVAEVMAKEGEPINPATLRKRFERVVLKLRRLAEQEGLLPTEAAADSG